MYKCGEFPSASTSEINDSMDLQWLISLGHCPMSSIVNSDTEITKRPKRFRIYNLWLGELDWCNWEKVQYSLRWVGGVTGYVATALNRPTLTLTPTCAGKKCPKTSDISSAVGTLAATYRFIVI